MTSQRMRDAAQILGELGNGKMANELISLSEEKDKISRDEERLEAAQRQIRELRGRLDAAEAVLEAHAIADPQGITAASLLALRDEIVKGIPDDSDSLIKVRATVGHFVDAVLKCERVSQGTERKPYPLDRSRECERDLGGGTDST
jgi:hypothetical protein